MLTPEAFGNLYSGLDREGPGLPEDVLWALAVAGTPQVAAVCDAGCGSGADIATLAEARARAARFGDRGRVIDGSMAELPGQHDLIWCAGAAYFPGLETALRGRRGTLAAGGRVAFSAPVYPRKPTAAARAFWQDKPGSVTEGDGITARIAAEGFRSPGQRMPIGAPRPACHAPLEARIKLLLGQTPSPELTGVLDASAREIAAWQTNPNDIAFALFVVEPA